MSVANFQDHIRARVCQMADEQLAMQERLMSLPDHEVVPFLKKMEEHAIELSQLASRLDVGAIHESPSPEDR